MNRAVEIFSEIPRKCNCAQAVAAGLERDDLLPELAACGGGKAPGGRCGALHAAMLIAGEGKAESDNCAIPVNCYFVPEYAEFCKDGSHIEAYGMAESLENYGCVI